MGEIDCSYAYCSAEGETPISGEYHKAAPNFRFAVIRPRLAHPVNFENRRKFDQGMPSVSVSRVVNDYSRTTHRELPEDARAAGVAAPTDTLLATDLHAGNVLPSQREPWLVIDPKPFIGDPPYDLVQHLHNCEARFRADPRGMVKRLANWPRSMWSDCSFGPLPAPPRIPDQSGAIRYGWISPGGWRHDPCARGISRPHTRSQVQSWKSSA